MAGYLGSTPVPQATQHRESFTATSGQTTFATAGYTAGFVDVYLNGSHLSPADFTATNGSDVVLASGASADDVCDIISHSAFEINAQSFTGTTTMDVAVIDGTTLATGILTATAKTVFNGGFGLPDSQKATFGGTGTGDLQIYHDGNSKIADVGDGKLELHSNGTGVFIQKGATEHMAKFLTDGAVELYHNNVKKLETTSGGVTVTGELVFGTAGDDIGVVSGKLTINSAGSNLVFSVGGTTEVNIDGTHMYPQADDNFDLGASGNRFDDIFATNGTIQTSDRNEKQDIAALTSAEMLVAKRISALFKTFRWKNKVAAKGNDARTHSGIIAQDVQAAFTAESLDAGDYSLFISSTWWETQTEVPAVEAVDEVTDEDGNVTTEAVEAKDAYTRTDNYDTEDAAPSGSTSRTRLGIRYPELLSFVAAYNEQRFASIETRLTALEG